MCTNAREIIFSGNYIPHALSGATPNGKNFSRKDSNVLMALADFIEKWKQFWHIHLKYLILFLFFYHFTKTLKTVQE